MCNCNSIWVQNAINELNSLDNETKEYHILKYLLTNFCGINNTTSQNDIVNYINSLDYTLSIRELQDILNEYKRKQILNVLNNPDRRKGGVFIPCNEDESLIAYKQVLSRISSQLHNVENNIIDQSIKNRLNILIQQVQQELNSL